MNLTDKIFQDDEAARLHLEAQRWPDGPYCPFCGTFDGVRRMTGASTKPGACHCKDCRKKFSVTVGTVFESSHIGLAKWMLAFRMMASSKKGVSALQIERTLGVTYKTAWFMAHRIREAMKVENPEPLGGEGKIIEIDETYVGGKEKNKHASKRLPRDLAADKKQIVVSLIERGGKARSFHVASVTSKTLRSVIVKSASRKSTLMTDGHKGYDRVGAEFAAHKSTDHSAGVYVLPGAIHSNSAASFFAIIKRGVYGNFHSNSEAHLPRYLAEFENVEFFFDPMPGCSRADWAQSAGTSRSCWPWPVHHCGL